MSHDQSSTTSHEWKQRTIVSAIAAALTPGWSGAAQAQDQNEANENRLEEVIVSARKREENVQDIPQSIQAFSQSDIDKVGITNLKDLAKFVPAMTVVGSSAGFNKIIFRGLADSSRPFIADSSAAIYLDEQPLTTGAQSPEIRPYDLARIETLAGPQGTLYGASSQSGTVRYIVNKPDASHFEGYVGGGLSYVHSGELGWDADAMMNIPLIEDQLAIRLVAFGGKDPGYIDNVFGYSPGRIDPDTGEVIQGSKTNQSIVRNNINSTPFKGLRASVKWLINDDWAVTGIYNYNDSRVNGYNDYDPTQGDLKTVKFHKESWDDNWNNFQLTLDGDLNGVLLTSSTSYFERDTAYVFDGTSGVAYYHSVLGVYGYGTCGTENAYYAAYNIYDFSTSCALNGVGYDVNDGDPTGIWNNVQRDTRWTHETRFTGNMGRWFWTAGFFYQQAKQHWAYNTFIDNYMDTQSWDAYNFMYGPLDPTESRWSSDERSKRTDWSVFGEATVDLNDKWKMLIGARWYDVQIDRTYTLRVPATGPADVSTPSGSDNGVLPKFGFQYFFADDRMVYALYSEGFRTGGINRARGNPTLPIQYGPDLLHNYEAGLKSQWMNGQLQFNLIGYHQVWKDMQLELTDPSYSYGEPYQTVIANVGDATVDGFDLEIFYQASEHVQLGWTSTYLFNAKIKDDIQVYDDRDPDDLALDIPGGTRLPLTADLNFSAFAEYDWQTSWMDGAQAYVRVQASYTGDSYNRLIDNDDDPDGTGYGGRAKQPHYNTWDLRTGMSNSDWEVSAFIDNVFDKRGVSFIDTNADWFWGRKNYLVIQPRTVGFRVKRYFN